MGPKILQLCAIDFVLAKFLAPLCFRQKELGFDVTAACTESRYMGPLREQGLRCVDLPIERSRNVFSHIGSYRRLSAWLQEEHFDIIHVHSPIAALIGRLAATRRGTPLTIYTAHGFYFHDEMPRVQRAGHVALERFGSLFGDYLFTQSDEDRLTAIRHKIAAPDRVRTIGNGVDLERFDPGRFDASNRATIRRSFGIPEDARVLGIIARLVREKGYFELFRATIELARRMPDFRLMVIGDALESDHDDSQNALYAFVDELGCRDRIAFTGRREDVPELLHALDVFTLPTYREGMPRSVIEAMAMGLPVVTTNIRGCREEVVDGETGFLVPTRNVDQLTERCASLLQDPAQARTMGQAGRQRAIDVFSEQLVLERQMEVYYDLMREKGIAEPTN